MNNIKFHCKKGYKKGYFFLQKKSKCLKDVLPTSGVH